MKPMSMIKVISPGAQDFSEPVAALVKVSSRGLRGIDLSAFEKRAGAQFAHEFAKLAQELKADEPPVHLLAIGATEDYGPNRNGDGFRREICREYHPTFKKFAHFFRNHDNKRAERAYGHVKLSAWHDPMKRIELIVALNGSEAAANRNGGLFADREMEKLARGEDIPVSMACKVSHDICSYCGNKAPRREDYCTSADDGGHCKAGGLAKNIGSLVEIDNGIHHLHADNPDPSYFDISHVWRPADRIAFTVGVLKAAGATTVGGAVLADALGVSLPYELLVDQTQPAQVQRMLKLAYELADYEAASLASGTPLYAHMVGAFATSLQPRQPLPPFARIKFAETMRALADKRIMLPLADFIELVTGHDREKSAFVAAVVRRELPGVYSRLITQDDLPERVGSCPYTPGPVASPAFRLWAEKQAQALSLQSAAVSRRVTRAALRHEAPVLQHLANPVKTAAARSPATELAEEYALYQLAFLGSIPESDPELQLTAGLSLLHNCTE
jgi:hypothetical protein